MAEANFERKRLTVAERRACYSAARDCYLKNRDVEQALIDFKNHPDVVGFSFTAILIQIAIELAVALFRWWLDNQVAVPSVVPSTSDPGFFDCDEVAT